MFIWYSVPQKNILFWKIMTTVVAIFISFIRSSSFNTRKPSTWEFCIKNVPSHSHLIRSTTKPSWCFQRSQVILSEMSLAPLVCDEMAFSSIVDNAILEACIWSLHPCHIHLATQENANWAYSQNLHFQTSASDFQSSWVPRSPLFPVQEKYHQIILKRQNSTCDPHISLQYLDITYSCHSPQSSQGPDNHRMGKLEGIKELCIWSMPITAHNPSKDDVYGEEIQFIFIIIVSIELNCLI